MALAPAFAELAQLRLSLRRLGYTTEISEMVLFPGQQRWTLIKWLMKGLLCGRDVDSVTLPMQDDKERGLPEQERLAARCVQLLALLGVRTTVEEVQGCSPELTRCQLLARLTQLLAAALPFQHAVYHRSTGQASTTTTAPASNSRGSSTGADAWSERSIELLDWAVDSKGQLLHEQQQLFPPDLQAVADQHRDAVGLLPQLQQHLSAELQRVGAQVEQLRAACGVSATNDTSSSSSSTTNCSTHPSSSSNNLFPQLGADASSSVADGADQGSSTSTSSMALVGQQLERLMGQLQQLQQVYDQRLGVWVQEADDAGCFNSREALGRQMGSAAAAVDGMYQQLQQLIVVVQQLQGAYDMVTQKLPRNWLQQVASQHRQEQGALAACCSVLEAV